MRIGIDVDGVLTDAEQYQIDMGTKYFYLNKKLEIKDISGYYVNDMFGVGDDGEEDLWRKIEFDYAVNEPARKFAGEVIGKLKEEGNEIYIITARSSDLSLEDGSKERMQKLLLDWLDNNGICYDKVIFSSEDKLGVCLENNIDLMIEDKAKNINDISSKIPVICFDARYNRDCVGDKIIRCYSWYDIYAKIKNKIVL